MADVRRGVSADQRLAQLQRDRARLRRSRLAREVAGGAARRMLRVVPALFDLDGQLTARRLLAPREAVIDALRAAAIFAGDTAMRLRHGAGFLTGGDVHAYLRSTDPLGALVRATMIDPEPWPDTVLARPWPGPPRLLVCITEAPPAFVVLPSGHSVVTPERLRRELIGAVGARADLFALLERLEEAAERKGSDGAL